MESRSAERTTGENVGSAPIPCFAEVCALIVPLFTSTRGTRSHYSRGIYSVDHSSISHFSFALLVASHIVMATSNVAGQPGAEWDEAQCTSALALLEQLQAQVRRSFLRRIRLFSNDVQIDDLRFAIPRVIEPFHQLMDATMYKQYQQGVEGSQESIKTLHEQWRKPETQEMFEHTRKSLASNNDLSASFSIPSYGWTERDRKERESRGSSRSERKNEDTLTKEEVTQIISEVKDWPNLKVETQEDNHTILVCSSISEI